MIRADTHKYYIYNIFPCQAKVCLTQPPLPLPPGVGVHTSRFLSLPPALREARGRRTVKGKTKKLPTFCVFCKVSAIQLGVIGLVSDYKEFKFCWASYFQSHL